MANMLPTEALTEFGGNFALSVEKRRRLCEIEVCAGVLRGNRSIDYFLIDSLQSTVFMGFSG